VRSSASTDPLSHAVRIKSRSQIHIDLLVKADLATVAAYSHTLGYELTVAPGEGGWPDALLTRASEEWDETDLAAQVVLSSVAKEISPQAVLDRLAAAIQKVLGGDLNEPLGKFTRGGR